MGTKAYEDQETSISGADAPETSRPHRKRKRMITGFGVALLFFLVFCVFALFNFHTVVVSGRSMEPTFHTGQRVLVSKAYWLVGPIRDNDVVVLKDTGPTGYIIKRVAYSDGETVDWKWVPDTYPIANGPYKVPEGQVYVLGDNKPESEDSRKFGPRDKGDILGKVIVW